MTEMSLDRESASNLNKVVTNNPKFNLHTLDYDETFIFTIPKTDDKSSALAAL